MKKQAVIINVTVNNEIYTVSYESGTVRKYKTVTKSISEWLDSHKEDNDEVTETIEEATGEITKETEEVTEVTALVVVEPAEIITEEITEMEEEKENAPIFRWEDLAGTIKSVAETIVMLGKAAAPVAKAGCIALLSIIRVVIIFLITIVKAVRMYGPEIIETMMIDVQIIYYKGKAAYFQGKMIARASMRAIKRARKTVKLNVWKAMAFSSDVVKMVIAPVMAAAVVVVMMIAKASAMVAKVAICGWNLREEIMHDIKNEEV